MTTDAGRRRREPTTRPGKPPSARERAPLGLTVFMTLVAVLDLPVAAGVLTSLDPLSRPATGGP